MKISYLLLEILLKSVLSLVVILPNRRYTHGFPLFLLTYYTSVVSYLLLHFILSKIQNLLLPLPLLHSIIPSSATVNKLLFLSTCPIQFIFLRFIFCNIFLSSPVLSASTFFTLSFLYAFCNPSLHLQHLYFSFICFS